MKEIKRDICIDIDGMGIVLYSKGLARDIPIGSNFLDEEFSDAADVGKHIRKGDITGFCTGSSGRFLLKFRSGDSDDKIESEYPVTIRLGIQVVDKEIRVVDLFWLSEFNAECSEKQIIEVEDGFYHITLNTKRPVSGIWGDNQVIYIHLKQSPQMPQLTWDGVPYLFTKE